jgi:hypothetical protein
MPLFSSRRCGGANTRAKENTMPRGDKSAYTPKQRRKARHIEESYEEHGISEKEAAARWRREIRCRPHEIGRQQGGGAARLGAARSGDETRPFAESRQGGGAEEEHERPSTQHELNGSHRIFRHLNRTHLAGEVSCADRGILDSGLT